MASPVVCSNSFSGTNAKRTANLPLDGAKNYDVTVNYEAYSSGTSSHWTLQSPYFKVVSSQGATLVNFEVFNDTKYGSFIIPAGQTVTMEMDSGFASTWFNKWGMEVSYKLTYYLKSPPTPTPTLKPTATPTNTPTDPPILELVEPVIEEPANYNAQSFIIAPQGDWTKSQNASEFKFRNEDDALWSARIDETKTAFELAPNGDWSGAHKDDVVRFTGNDGALWFCKMDTDNINFIFAPKGDWKQFKKDYTINYKDWDGNSCSLMRVSEVQKFDDPIKLCRISGFISPDYETSDSKDLVNKSGFKIELDGTFYSANTNENGYFEIADIPESDTEPRLKISKPYYLNKYVKIESLAEDLKISDAAVPITMFQGDLNNDEVINMSDMLMIARNFNTIAGDGKYEEMFDLNKDKSVNLKDVLIIAKNFNITAK